MPDSCTHKDPYREPVQELLFDARRDVKEVALANAAGCKRQFINKIIGGLTEKTLPLRALLSMWEHGPRPLTDRIARLLERVNPGYVVRIREVDPAADPVSRSCAHIHKGVDFFEAIRVADSDRVRSDAEKEEIQAMAAAMKEEIDSIVAGFCNGSNARGQAGPVVRHGGQGCGARTPRVR